MPVHVGMMILDLLPFFGFIISMVLIYLKTLLDLLVNYGLESIQGLLPTPTAAYFDCLVIYFPSDHSKIWASVDEIKNHRES